MPLTAKSVLLAIAAVFAALAAFLVWRVLAGRSEPWTLLLSALLVIAAIGLLRRLAWARFLVSCFSVLSSFDVAMLLIPHPDDLYSGGGALERAFGFMPPLWFAWLLVVVASTLPLIPALIISWRKNWFRGKIW